MGDRRRAVQGQAAEDGRRDDRRERPPLGPSRVQVCRARRRRSRAAGAAAPQLARRPRLSAVSPDDAVRRAVGPRPRGACATASIPTATPPSRSTIRCRRRSPTASGSTWTAAWRRPTSTPSAPPSPRRATIRTCRRRQPFTDIDNRVYVEAISRLAASHGARLIFVFLPEFDGATRIEDRAYSDAPRGAASPTTATSRATPACSRASRTSTAAAR